MRTTEAREATWSDTLTQLVTLVIIPDKLHRILLYGPPGTGKSTWASRVFGADRVERIAMHKQQFVEDLIGGQGLQNGSTVFQLGLAPRCMRDGKVLVLDEIDQFSPETRSALHAILDDLEIACIRLPGAQEPSFNEVMQEVKRAHPEWNGADEPGSDLDNHPGWFHDARRLLEKQDSHCITPAPGFCVVATTNARPDSLPDALRDRFDLFVYCDKPAQGLLSRLSAASAQVLRNHYAREFSGIAAWQRPVTCRSILAFERLALALGEGEQNQEQAAQHIFGANAREMLNTIACAAK